MAIRVSDVMTRGIIYSKPDESVRDVAAKMRDNRVSSIVIATGEVMHGIVTEHDFVDKILSAGKDPSRVKITEIMSKQVVTIHPESELEEAARIMRDMRIKKLIAVKDGTPVGIITSYDILVAEPVIRLLIEKGL